MYRRCGVLVGTVGTIWLLGVYVSMYIYIYIYIMDLINAREIERFKISKLYSTLTREIYY